MTTSGSKTTRRGPKPMLSRAAVLDAAGPQLKIVANVAVGYNNIDVPACRSRGVVAVPAMIFLSSAPRRVAGHHLAPAGIAGDLRGAGHQTLPPRARICATAASMPIRSIVLIASVLSRKRTWRPSDASQ